MRRSGIERLGPFVPLSALALLVACNALNGAGDLTVGPCVGCEALDGSASDSSGGGTTDVPTVSAPDASLDGPAGDTSVEGPGGILDPTFGTGGTVIIDPLVFPHAVAVRADGRIVVAGTSSNDLAVAAFTSTGAVDMTFGTAGRITKASGSSSIGNAVAFDSQGRALVVGSAVVVTTVATRYAYAVRVGASQVDTTFGSSGSLRGVVAGEDARGVVITAGDGAVLAIGGSNDHQFLRLGQNGAPDQAFGNNGTASVDNMGGEPAGLVAFPSGFVSGGTGNAPGAGGGRALAAAKVSLTGQPTLAFGLLARATSKVGPDNTEEGRSIAAQADGKVLVSGDYDPSVNLVKRVSAVTRFTASGQVDASYGNAGKVTIDLTDSLLGRDTETTSTNVLVDSKGRSLVVGSVYEKLLLGGERRRIWVVRLRADGSLDPLFGNQGKLFVGTMPAGLEARGAALQPDGKLVIVGLDTNGNKLFLARMITSTTL